MPQGLQCFDANGVCILDYTQRITNIIGSAYTNSVNGALSDDAFTKGTGFVIITSIDGVPSIGTSAWKYNIAMPEFSFSGNTLTWSYVSVSSGNLNFKGNIYPNVHFLYGIY